MGGGGINQKFGIRYKLLYIKQIRNKVVLYSIGNYIQYLIINHNKKKCGKKICIYVQWNPFAVHQTVDSYTVTQLCFS